MKTNRYKMSARLSILLLSLLTAFSLSLPGCSREDAGAAADLALAVLDAVLEEDAGTSENRESLSNQQESGAQYTLEGISGEIGSASSQKLSPSLPSSSVRPSAAQYACPQIPPSVSSSPASSENQAVPPQDSQLAPPEDPLSEDGWYSSKEEVALYLHTYGKLPGNYLTKKEASALGWDSNKGNLWEAAPGMSIGGDIFGNREGLLPKADGRVWYECDIGYEGGYRGANRLVYSSDGLIYYTEDHYQSFEALYS